MARWYVEREGGGALTRKLITIGTPHRGAVAAAIAMAEARRRAWAGPAVT